MLVLLFFLLSLASCYSAPSNCSDYSSQCAKYYSGIVATNNASYLFSQFSNLIHKHTSLSYNALWHAYSDVWSGPDHGCPTGKIWNVYSDKCFKTSEECGNYHKEGDCFNREHVWCKSWFGGFTKGHGAQTDLFNVYPADGYVNGERSNNPVGPVDPHSVKYRSNDGALVGDCLSSSGFSGTCFEPPAAMKGVIARVFFYVTTAYNNEFSCCNVAGVNGSKMKPWMLDVMLDWNAQNPSTESERYFNDKVFAIQKNRNPFIDFDSLAAKLFK